MKFTVYGKGNRLRVAFFNVAGYDDDIWESGLWRISEYCSVEIHGFLVDRDMLQVFGGVYNNEHTDKRAEDAYSYILRYIETSEISIGIFFSSGRYWTASFLDRFKKLAYAACYFVDDPEGSEGTSKPYVRNYTYAFCGGIYFDETRRIEDVYREWGARKSKFIPLGVNPEKYREPMNAFGGRKIDLVYVGGCYFPKVLRMFRLKRHFGNRMVMYGRGWNESTSKMKTMVLRVLKLLYKVPYIEELPRDRLVELYQNTKIGFNIHMSYGPSNVRTYELPANGVMQVCDCRDGLGEIYEIGKEVVPYDSLSDAIEKIEYYLNHEEERNIIARAGYNKAVNEYTLEVSVRKILDEILSDIRVKFNNVYRLDN